MTINILEATLAGVAAWPGARHMRGEGLGHRRTLADPRVVGSAIHFISTNTYRKESP